MITLKEDTTFVGVSELRTHLDQIISQSKKNKVMIERRHRPIAVLMNIDTYNELEDRLEYFEDYVFGRMAKERQSKSKPSDYLSTEEVFKKIKTSK